MKYPANHAVKNDSYSEALETKIPGTVRYGTTRRALPQLPGKPGMKREKSREDKEIKVESACKPGSVVDSHSSGMCVAAHL